MKKLILYIIFSVLIFSDLQMEYYENINGKIYYIQNSYGKELMEADSKSFEVINQYYGKDKSNIFFEGRKISSADPLTFIILTHGYAKDKNYAYYVGVEF